MTVLVIAPHPDDESIGCGGALRLHAVRGDRVVALFLTSGGLGLKHLAQEKARQIREREARAAAKILGLAGEGFMGWADWMVSDDVGGAGHALLAILIHVAPAFISLHHMAY